MCRGLSGLGHFYEKQHLGGSSDGSAVRCRSSASRLPPSTNPLTLSGLRAPYTDGPVTSPRPIAVHEYFGCTDERPTSVVASDNASLHDRRMSLGRLDDGVDMRPNVRPRW